jgi:hypothetical protein
MSATPAVEPALERPQDGGLDVRDIDLDHVSRATG